MRKVKQSDSKRTFFIDEDMEWLKLTPVQRILQTTRLWKLYLTLGGSLDPEPDPQSPFYEFEKEEKEKQKSAIRRRHMKSILKLKHHNSRKEIEFELKYLKSLTIKKRFEMMLKKTREIISLLEKNGHRRPFEVIKRT